ncbi:MAG: hypothetical protein AB7S26_10910 [Sandaracinaceae bacterium]
MKLAPSTVLAAVVLVGCAASEPPVPASLELGTGSWRFEPLTDGDTVPLIHGAQGGYHMWTSVRVPGVDTESLQLTIELQPADESAPVQRDDLGVFLEPPDDEGVRSAVGLTAIFNDPGCAVGALYRVKVSTTLDDGTILSDERDVMIDPGTEPPPACGTIIEPPG